ncbi:MAG: hypothetical protein AB1489_41155 [Acidobacteriota bacterium]
MVVTIYLKKNDWQLSQLTYEMESQEVSRLHEDFICFLHKGEPLEGWYFCSLPLNTHSSKNDRRTYFVFSHIAAIDNG